MTWNIGWVLDVQQKQFINDNIHDKFSIEDGLFYSVVLYCTGAKLLINVWQKWGVSQIGIDFLWNSPKLTVITYTSKMLWHEFTEAIVNVIYMEYYNIYIYISYTTYRHQQRATIDNALL